MTKKLRKNGGPGYKSRNVKFSAASLLVACAEHNGTQHNKQQGLQWSAMERNPAPFRKGPLWLPIFRRPIYTTNRPIKRPGFIKIHLVMKPQYPKPGQSKDPKSYNHWYWHNVPKPKLELEHPEPYTQSLSKSLPNDPNSRIYSFTCCGKEFTPKNQKQKCCSQSCNIKLGYDLKHGIARKPAEEYCHICEKVKPREEFTVNKQKPSGHGALCVPCHNNYYNQKAGEI